MRDFIFDSVDKVPVLSSPTDKSVPRVKTGEMMDVKIEKNFSGLNFPSIKDGGKAGMTGIWLPVKVRLANDAD